MRSKSWKRSCDSLQRPPDRAAGVVDHEVDRRQLGRSAARTARRSPRGRRGRTGRRAPCRRGARSSAWVSSSLSLPRATSTGMPPAWATLSAVTWPMPDEAPVITTYLPVERLAVARVAAGGRRRGSPPSSPTASAAYASRSGTAMPEPASAFSVRRESKTGGEATCARAPRPGCRAGRWSGRARPATGAELDAAPFDQRRAGAARGGAAPSGAGVVTLRSIGVANCGAPAAAQNALTMSTTGCGSGLTRWNASPSRSGRWREVVHRLGDVVDRHHVGVAEVDADQRQPAPAGCRAAA